MSLLNAVIQEAKKTNTEDVAKAPNELLAKIIDLSERLQVFSWGLQNYFIDVYLTSDSARSLEQMNYKNRKYRADADIDELKEEIEDFRKEFGDKYEAINNSCKNFEETLKNYNDSCTLVGGTYILQTAARDLKSLKYVDCIVSLKELHKKLDKLSFLGDLAKALRSFRAISDTQLAVSQGQLSVEFSKIFTWNYTRGINTLTYSLSVQQNDPILLERVLRALYIADQMVIDIQPFSHFFVNILVPSIIRQNCEIFTEDHIGALVFNIKIDLNDDGRPSIPTIFNNLMAAFEFLETTMGAKLENDKTFFQALGDCNREDFFNKIIQDCIKNRLPSCHNSHLAYKEIVLELDTFNKFLVDINYVQASKSPLQKYIDHTDLLLYDTKYKKMLNEVRELIRDYLSNTTVVVGSVPDAPDTSILDVTDKTFRYNLNAPVFFPKCVITHNVMRIATIIKTSLEECAKMPIEFANQLIPYIKDIAMLYQAMVCQRNGVRLKTHAMEIALFFNNCQYLSHCLVGPPWKNILPKSIADQLNTVLTSYIYDLRIIGIEKMSIFLRRNRESICATVAGFYRHWRLEAFETFNRDVNHVLVTIREMRDTWYEVLPGRMYQKAISLLVEAVCEAMVRRSLRYVEDITEDVVCLLASRFQYAIDEILDMFPEMVTLETHSKYWDKFLLIPKLFTAQILEIARMWNDGNSLRSKFNCDEVRLIIKMRFPNSEYRLKILKGIQ